jgi:ubiquinone/menaquinone biosynthesis C-methylase UbiE
MAKTNEFIDVRQLIDARSVAEHCQLAEEYFAKLGDQTHHLSKPFGAIDETPQLLINLAMVLHGLAICPGMTVLEFGAGTCWASRALTQLGCRVVAADVSATALRIGQELYARHPPFGDRPPPRFLLFDGRRLELEDESIDRIICLDSFHHVPNPKEVLSELGRVLVDGGVAGFAEPGPEHSLTAQSQYEMRTHGVIENDIDTREIWAVAREAGFTDLKLAAFSREPLYLALNEFEDFLAGGKIGKQYANATRESLKNQRTFFLYKGTVQPKDSRYRGDLRARIEVSPASLVVSRGEAIRVHAKVTNVSNAVWLPRSAGLGAVLLGCDVYCVDGRVFRESFHWEALTPNEGRPILPGEVVEVEAEIPTLPRGKYFIEFDMVSNDVCWFAINGSETPRISVEVN